MTIVKYVSIGNFPQCSFCEGLLSVKKKKRNPCKDVLHLDLVERDHVIKDNFLKD